GEIIRHRRGTCEVVHVPGGHLPVEGCRDVVLEKREIGMIYERLDVGEAPCHQTVQTENRHPPLEQRRTEMGANKPRSPINHRIYLRHVSPLQFVLDPSPLRMLPRFTAPRDVQLSTTYRYH